MYDAEPVSFSCVLSVISDIREGNVSVDTARKVLKQIDAGLAQFGVPKPIGVRALSDDDMLSNVEQLCSVSGLADTALEEVVKQLITYLPQLLDMILKRYL